MRFDDSFDSYIEQCDDKNILNGDGCSEECLIETDFQCIGFPSDCISLKEE